MNLIFLLPRRRRIYAPELAFVIQWPFLCNVFSLHLLFHPSPLTHSPTHSHIPTPRVTPAHRRHPGARIRIYNIIIYVYIRTCPSGGGGGGGVRIEFARVRKALSRAFYNCCYYHLIKILRTLFLRLFDTHARTHTRTREYTCECV